MDFESPVFVAEARTSSFAFDTSIAWVADGIAWPGADATATFARGVGARGTKEDALRDDVNGADVGMMREGSAGTAPGKLLCAGAG